MIFLAPAIKYFYCDFVSILEIALDFAQFFKCILFSLKGYVWVQGEKFIYRWNAYIFLVIIHFLRSVTLARNILQLAPTQPDPTFIKTLLVLLDLCAKN